MNVTRPANTSRRVLLSPWLWAIVAGAALGTAYAASPVTLWFLVAMAGLFAWAGRGLTPRERRWVWGLLVVAVALRLVAVAVLAVTSDPHRVGAFFWEGDSRAFKLRSIWIRNVWMGIPLPPRSGEGVLLDVTRTYAAALDPYGWTTFIYVLAYLQFVLGPAPYGMHLVNIALFLATIVMLYRLVRTSFSRESALVGLALLLFLPTLFAWSVSVLKEPAFVFLLALALVAVVTALRARSTLFRAFAVAALVGSIATIDGVRLGGRMVAVVGLIVGFAGSVVLRRAWLWVVVTVLLVVVSRQALNNPDIQLRVMSQLRASAAVHLGHIRTEGHGYTLLDPRFYGDSRSNTVLATMTAGEGLRFVVRALVGFVVVPLPWQMESLSEMVFLPQQVLWYLLVVLAVVGLVAGLRRDALVTCLLAGVAVVSLAAIAINSGNVGTMLRHRDTVVPFVVWLSALGGVEMVSGWMSRGRRGGILRTGRNDALEVPSANVVMMGEAACR